jgi:hypothetical protein
VYTALTGHEGAGNCTLHGGMRLPHSLRALDKGILAPFPTLFHFGILHHFNIIDLHPLHTINSKDNVYTPFYCPAKRTNTQTKREHTETPTLSMIDSASASDVYDNVSGYVCDYDLDEAYRKYVKDK